MCLDNNLVKQPSQFAPLTRYGTIMTFCCQLIEQNRVLKPHFKSYMLHSTGHWRCPRMNMCSLPLRRVAIRSLRTVNLVFCLPCAYYLHNLEAHENRLILSCRMLCLLSLDFAIECSHTRYVYQTVWSWKSWPAIHVEAYGTTWGGATSEILVLICMEYVNRHYAALFAY